MSQSATVFDLAMRLQTYRLSLADYAPIRAAYSWDIQSILYEYLSTDGVKLTRFRNQMKRAITESFYDAFAQGWLDGDGGQFPDEADQDALDWLGAAQTAEYGYVDQLFYRLRDLKKEGAEAWANEPAERAEGYAKTLDGVYKEAKMRAAKNKMLTFGGNDGAESCKTCRALKGKRHKASWWVKRGLVPGQPGNRAFECGGWNCEHYLYDDTGNLFVA